MSKHKRVVVPQLRRAFMTMEATAFAGGGFPAFMTDLMSSMEEHMQIEGHAGPYKWEWSGGDGQAVPVILTIFQDAANA